MRPGSGVNHEEALPTGALMRATYGATEDDTKGIPRFVPDACSNSSEDVWAPEAGQTVEIFGLETAGEIFLSFYLIPPPSPDKPCAW